jgi:hypothetical protein
LQHRGWPFKDCFTLNGQPPRFNKWMSERAVSEEELGGRAADYRFAILPNIWVVLRAWYDTSFSRSAFCFSRAALMNDQTTAPTNGNVKRKNNSQTPK